MFRSTPCLATLIVVCFAGLSVAAEPVYKSPYGLIATKDASTIYVLLHEADGIAVLNVAENKVVRTISVGKQPNAFSLSPDEKILYVAVGGYKGSLQAVDTASGKAVKQVPTGHSPWGISITPDGKKVYVSNRFSGDVSEYGLPEMNLVRKIKTIREPRSSVVTPDGKTVFVLNFLPDDPNNIPEDPDALIDVAAEITAIDTATGETKNIRLPNGSHSLYGICVSPDGRFAYVSTTLARFQMPTTQLERGWMSTSGISVIDVHKREFINTVLIDDVDLGAANPWGITTSADGKQIYVAVSGTNELIIVDTEPLHKKLDALPKDSASGEQADGGGSSSAKSSDVPNDLAFLVGMKKRVKLDGKGPRPIVAVGANVYLGMYFDDALQKVDPNAPGGPKGVEVSLGPKTAPNDVRLGELYWHDATLCFQLWQSCATCHPDARMDALNWDLLNDGLGNPKNAKSLLWCYKTPPTMWEGVRTSSAHCTRTGFQYILFSMPDEEKCLKIDAYLHALAPLESPHLVDGKLSAQAERGKKIFEDSKVGCAKCHPAPLFTDLKMHDVNSKVYYDRKPSFDTPTLIECWRTAPYLHDGRYTKMKDVFKLGKHGDVEGDIEGLTDEQLDDLVEYVQSL